VQKPEGKRPLARPRYRWKDNIKLALQEVGWKDNIKLALQEVGWGGMDWIALAQDRCRWRVLVNAAVNLRFPQKVRNWPSGRRVSFSGYILFHGVSQLHHGSSETLSSVRPLDTLT